MRGFVPRSEEGESSSVRPDEKWIHVQAVLASEVRGREERRGGNEQSPVFRDGETLHLS